MNTSSAGALSETRDLKKNQAANLGGLMGVDIGTDFVPGDDFLYSLFDWNDVLSRDKCIAEQPVPNKLLTHGLTHDFRQSTGKLGLATSSFDCSVDGLDTRFLCHGAKGTQPQLCLQQLQLLGCAQLALYSPRMTYGERLQKAMDYATLDQPGLVNGVIQMLIAENPAAKITITQQTISKALRSSRSIYTSRFARVCQVSAEWLETGVGEMALAKNVDSISNWPFSFDELRFRRLMPVQKQTIENAVLAIIEGFEGEAVDAPKKKRKRRR